MYFDVHSDYMTSLHHPWYKSGFVLLKKNLKKMKKKIEKYLCLRVHCNCVHIQYVQQTPSSSLGPSHRSGHQGSSWELGHLILHLQYIQVKRYSCLNIAIVVMITSPSTAERVHVSLLSVCKLWNVASFTLPCYVTTLCRGRSTGHIKRRHI